ncbi:MAG: rhodanese-like domain-containing protein [Saprospiraceae bacterium]|nr:rhodanese-like domain-containing protein [Saprospiraceae bacterium]MDW8484569.1 rhodanese-like domain-containing protein [Saprospiraceae bacterium]
MRLIIFITLCTAILAGACQTRKFSFNPGISISVEEAYALSKKGVLLVDVREPQEVAEVTYQVKNYRNVPLSQLESRFQEIPRDRPVILACRSGNRSRKAYEVLTAKGYRNLTSIEGGLLAWEARNLPVIRKK